MIEPFKRVVRRHWPRLRLRTILLLTFTFVAALPGFGALFLRVYENALVRQTEAELIAQASALSATASLAWHGGGSVDVPRAQSPAIDLRLTPIFPARPAPRPATSPPDTTTRDWSRRVAPALRLGAMLLGRVFSGWDVVTYAAAVGLGVAIDRTLRQSTRQRLSIRPC